VDELAEPPELLAVEPPAAVLGVTPVLVSLDPPLRVVTVVSLLGLSSLLLLPQALIISTAATPVAARMRERMGGTS
jgi:hypothetical protein